MNKFLISATALAMASTSFMTSAKEKFNYTINDRDEILIKYILAEKFKYKNNDVVGKLEVYNKKNKIFDTDIYIKIKKKKIDVIEYMLGLFK